jgi:hypothetical protein
MGRPLLLRRSDRLAKAGLDGGALIAVPLLAALFGAKASSGLLLGVLITADLVAVVSYRKSASVAHLVRTLPGPWPASYSAYSWAAPSPTAPSA